MVGLIGSTQTNHKVIIMDIASLDNSDILSQLKEFGITPHHKTGASKLRELLAEAKKKATVPVAEVMADKSIKVLTVAEADKLLTKEQRALRLVRVIVSPNDPLMSSYPGLIFTVGSSAVNNGRMIKKYVPFNNEEGFHVPQIIHDHS